jgi:hypothetical protein
MLIFTEDGRRLLFPPRLAGEGAPAGAGEGVVSYGEAANQSRLI